MLESAGDFGLAQKPRAPVGAGGMSAMQTFERHFAIEFAVLGNVDLPQAAGGVRPQDFESLAVIGLAVTRRKRCLSRKC